MKRLRDAFAVVAICLALPGCGYHVAGKADLVPASIHTIAVPAFSNVTTRYKLTDRMPEAIAHEFIAETRYRVVADPKQADAILNGTIINYASFPVIVAESGRATGLQIILTMGVSLTDRKTGNIIFSRPSFEMRQRYEISLDPQRYFEESDAGLQRLSQDAARTIVRAILENF